MGALNVITVKHNFAKQIMLVYCTIVYTLHVRFRVGALLSYQTHTLFAS